ncbi:MAG: phosphoribosyltransferase [Planctomycetota bacterium]|jgi:predicted phosphoribosyltransferase
MFADRRDAGRRLAVCLSHLEGRDLVVLGLPRGGVVVAAEIARHLEAPLDVLVVRKLGAPAQPELAIGAVTDGEHPRVFRNEDVLRSLGVSGEYLEYEIERQVVEVDRLQGLYRDGRPAERLADRTVVVVDDGIATGATVRAGIQALRSGPVGEIVLAVPVAPREVQSALRREADEFVCPLTPFVFRAVGSFYEDFRQVTDGEVITLLAESAQRLSRGTGGR